MNDINHSPAGIVDRNQLGGVQALEPLQCENEAKTFQSLIAELDKMAEKEWKILGGSDYYWEIRAKKEGIETAQKLVEDALNKRIEIKIKNENITQMRERQKVNKFIEDLKKELEI